jgi:hypothetical protein
LTEENVFFTYILCLRDLLLTNQLTRCCKENKDRKEAKVSKQFLYSSSDVQTSRKVKGSRVSKSAGVVFIQRQLFFSIRDDGDDGEAL